MTKIPLYTETNVKLVTALFPEGEWVADMFVVYSDLNTIGQKVRKMSKINPALAEAIAEAEHRELFFLNRVKPSRLPR